jgi:putative membrane protein insertion efficiency factor
MSLDSDDIRRAPVRALIFVIQTYRHMVSPLRLPTCRFTPTCSQYAVDALSEFGFLRGSALATVRLLKCGPWHRGGWDPIPDRLPKQHRRVSNVDAADDGRNESHV